MPSTWAAWPKVWTGLPQNVCVCVYVRVCMRVCVIQISLMRCVQFKFSRGVMWVYSKEKVEYPLTEL